MHLAPWQRRVDGGLGHPFEQLRAPRGLVDDLMGGEISALDLGGAGEENAVHAECAKVRVQPVQRLRPWKREQEVDRMPRRHDLEARGSVSFAVPRTLQSHRPAHRSLPLSHVPRVATVTRLRGEVRLRRRREDGRDAEWAVHDADLPADFGWSILIYFV